MDLDFSRGEPALYFITYS